VSEPRLAAAVEASAIVRRVANQGDFGTILKRGDSERGSLLLVVSSRGEHVACLQRVFDFDGGGYQWNRVGPERSRSSEEVRNFLDQQTRFDPDLWQIELDIAEPERFIAETTASG